MEEAIISEGRCLFCDQLFSKSTITRHLVNHLEAKQKLVIDENRQFYCHIKVEADVMFLHLLVNYETKMKQIDKLLREIWLECCGHKSGFFYNNIKISMTEKAQFVFEPHAKIHHDYDFGELT